MTVKDEDERRDDEIMEWEDRAGNVVRGTRAEYFEAQRKADPGEWYPPVDGLD